MPSTRAYPLIFPEILPRDSVLFSKHFRPIGLLSKQVFFVCFLRSDPENSVVHPSGLLAVGFRGLINRV